MEPRTTTAPSAPSMGLPAHCSSSIYGVYQDLPGYLGVPFFLQSQFDVQQSSGLQLQAELLTATS